MEIKKSLKADLEGKKSIFFEVGLVLALGILFLAFEWKSSAEDVGAFKPVPEEQMEEEIIPITQQMMQPPPPPPPAPRLADLIDIVEDETSIDEELEITDAEDKSENKEVVNASDFGDYGTEDTGEADIFQVVEDMPVFPGNVQKWIVKNVKYPVLAMENGIQGKVIVQFIIEKDGHVSDAKVLRGVDSSLDKEALRVINSMPKWKAGRQRNKPVRVSYTLPINFQLSSN